MGSQCLHVTARFATSVAEGCAHDELQDELLRLWSNDITEKVW